MMVHALRALILPFMIAFVVATGAQSVYIHPITDEWIAVDKSVLVDQLVTGGYLEASKAQEFVAKLKEHKTQTQQAETFQRCSTGSPNASWNECYNKAYGIDLTIRSHYYYPGIASKHALDNLWFLNPEDLQKFQDLSSAYAAKLE